MLWIAIGPYLYLYTQYINVTADEVWNIAMPNEGLPAWERVKQEQIILEACNENHRQLGYTRNQQQSPHNGTL